MDKESIQNRLKELEAGRNQAQANLLAHEGAIQELTSWLNKLPDKVSENIEEQKRDME